MFFEKAELVFAHFSRAEVGEEISWTEVCFWWRHLVYNRGSGDVVCEETRFRLGVDRREWRHGICVWEGGADVKDNRGSEGVVGDCVRARRE